MTAEQAWQLTSSLSLIKEENNEHQQTHNNNDYSTSSTSAPRHTTESDTTTDHDVLTDSLFASVFHHNLISYTHHDEDPTRISNVRHTPSSFNATMTTTTTNNNVSTNTTTTTTNNNNNVITTTTANVHSATATTQLRPVLKRNAKIECFVVRPGTITAKPTKRGPSPETLHQLSLISEADLQPVSLAHVRSTAVNGSFPLESEIFAVGVDDSLDIPADDVGDRCRAQAHPRVVDCIGSVQRPDDEGYFYADTSQHWAPGYGRRKNASDTGFAKYNWRPKVVDANLHVLLGQKRVRQLRQISDSVARPIGVDAYVYVLTDGPLAHKFWFMQYYRNVHGLEVKPYVAPKRALATKRSAGGVPVSAAPLETQTQSMFFASAAAAASAAANQQVARPDGASTNSGDAAVPSMLTASLFGTASMAGMFGSTTGGASGFPMFSFVRSQTATNTSQPNTAQPAAKQDLADSGGEVLHMQKRKHIAALGESAGIHAALDLFTTSAQFAANGAAEQPMTTMTTTATATATRTMRTSASAPDLGFFGAAVIASSTGNGNGVEAVVEMVDFDVDQAAAAERADAAEGMQQLFLSLSIDENPNQLLHESNTEHQNVYNSGMLMQSRR
jgi:hypothetical protein